MEKQEIQDNASKGLHLAGERNRVISASVFTRDSPQVVILRVVAEQGPNRLVDASGKTVKDEETSDV